MFSRKHKHKSCWPALAVVIMLCVAAPVWGDCQPPYFVNVPENGILKGDYTLGASFTFTAEEGEPGVGIAGYAIVSDPSGLATLDSNGYFFMPASASGTYFITIGVTNGCGAAAEYPFQVRLVDYDNRVMIKDPGFVSDRVVRKTISVEWENQYYLGGMATGHEVYVIGDATAEIIVESAHIIPPYDNCGIWWLFKFDTGSAHTPPIDTILVVGFYIQGIPCTFPPGALRPVWEFDLALTALGNPDTAVICIDSCFVPPNGYWKWDCGTTGGIKYPSFNNDDGPFCFQYGYNGICGDANDDGIADISDVLTILYYIFYDTPPVAPFNHFDNNCDGAIDISDALWILSNIFRGGPDPCDADGDGVPDC